jgi:hypothetical protein
VQVVIVVGVLGAGCGFQPGRVASDAGPGGSDVITADAPGDAAGDTLLCEQPVAHWSFEEGAGSTAADSSGRNNHLTLMGTATWTAGQAGSALSLPGGSWATLPYNQTFAATRQVSMTAWIRPAAATTTGALVVKSARLGPYQDWGFYAQAGEVLYINNWPSPDLRGTTTGFGLVAAEWTHVGFVLDVDAGTTAFYKNGALQSTLPFTVDLLQHDEPITVGTDGGNTANDFVGAVDDITVWTRALTAAEVATLHAGNCVSQ